MEYVFCEFCQSEVEHNDSLTLDFQVICLDCWDQKYPEKKIPNVKKGKEKGLQKNHTD